MRITRLFPLFIVLASVSLGATDPKAPPTWSLSSPDREEDMSDALNLTSWSWRYWTGSYLVTHNLRGSASSPVVALFDSTGTRIREGRVWFPSASSVSVRGATADPKGNLFVSGGTRSEDGSLAFFVAQLSDRGEISSVVRTTPFIGLHLCAPGDGTIWALGSDRQAQREGSTNLILRQFNFSNGELRAALDVRSLFSDSLFNSEATSLFCSPHKAGVLLNSATEWVEFDYATSRISWWRLPELREQRRVNGLAMTSEGELFATVDNRSGSEPVVGLFRLEKLGEHDATWLPIRQPVQYSFEGQREPSRMVRLLGSDGKDLVYTAKRNNKVVVLWSHLNPVRKRQSESE
jgi:hypothetical protein